MQNFLYLVYPNVIPRKKNHGQNFKTFFQKYHDSTVTHYVDLLKIYCETSEKGSTPMLMPCFLER